MDTPGTNAVLRHHEQLTSEFIPRSDFILFVTSADRPFTESERQLPGAHPRLGQEDRARAQQGGPAARRRTRLGEVMALPAAACHGAARLDAGDFPDLGAAGAGGAAGLRGDEGMQLYERSRLGALRDYLLRTLDDEGRTRLKLLTPLGVMQRLSDQVPGRGGQAPGRC